MAIVLLEAMLTLHDDTLRDEARQAMKVLCKKHLDKWGEQAARQFV